MVRELGFGMLVGFGLVHLMNPAATMTGSIFIAIEAGILPGAAYMQSRRQWMGMGFHAARNRTRSAVLSRVVSGSEADPWLIKPVSG